MKILDFLELGLMYRPDLTFWNMEGNLDGYRQYDCHFFFKKKSPDELMSS